MKASLSERLVVLAYGLGSAWHALILSTVQLTRDVVREAWGLEAAAGPVRATDRVNGCYICGGLSVACCHNCDRRACLYHLDHFASCGPLRDEDSPGRWLPEFDSAAGAGEQPAGDEGVGATATAGPASAAAPTEAAPTPDEPDLCKSADCFPCNTQRRIRMFSNAPIAKPAPASLACPHCKGPWRPEHLCSAGEAHVCNPGPWSSEAGGWVCPTCGKVPPPDWYVAWRKANP